MALDLEQQEQIETLKAFWSKWGTPIVLIIFGVSISLIGMRLWDSYQEKRSLQDKPVYEKLLESIEKKDTKIIKQAALESQTKYAGSHYTILGNIQAAKTLMSLNDPASAISILQWARDYAKRDDIAAIAKLALTAAYIDLKQYTKARSEIAQSPPVGFESLYMVSLGDIFLAEGKINEAREQYKKAALHEKIIQPNGQINSLQTMDSDRSSIIQYVAIKWITAPQSK